MLGCGNHADPSTVYVNKMKYDMIIASEIDGSGHAAEFNHMFPKAKNTISYFNGEAGPSKWTSSIGLYGRYVLAMTFPIVLDSNKVKVVSEGAPEFFLYELAEITDEGGGRYYLHANQLPTDSVTLEKWQTLVATKGNFSAAGISLVTNNPVSNFESAWRTFR
jgi:hypothetical protein